MHPKIKWKGKERDMLEFAKTPPKGWNSWDVYGASVTEEEVKTFKTIYLHILANM